MWRGGENVGGGMCGVGTKFVFSRRFLRYAALRASTCFLLLKQEVFKKEAEVRRSGETSPYAHACEGICSRR